MSVTRTSRLAQTRRTTPPWVILLTTWAETAEKSRPHYGASYLFVGYLMEHFGQDKLLQGLLASPGTGIDAVNGALQRTGHSERFDDVFKDWVVANYMNDPTVARDLTSRLRVAANGWRLGDDADANAIRLIRALRGVEL